MLSLSGVPLPQRCKWRCQQSTRPGIFSSLFFCLFFPDRYLMHSFLHCSVFDRTTHLNAIFCILYLSVSQLSSRTKWSAMWLPHLIIASQAQDDINNFFAKIFGENLKCSLMFIFSSRVKVLLMFILVSQVESVRSRAWSLTWTSVSPPSPSVTPARWDPSWWYYCWWYNVDDTNQGVTPARWEQLEIHNAVPTCDTSWWYYVDDTLLMMLCLMILTRVPALAWTESVDHTTIMIPACDTKYQYQGSGLGVDGECRPVWWAWLAIGLIGLLLLGG